jgi:hypothetical protein
MLKHSQQSDKKRQLSSLCALIALCVVFLGSSASLANDVSGDFNNNYENSTVNSNNADETVTNNYNATGAGSPAPVMSSVAPTVMGGGGNDSCLMPRSMGIQLTVIGISNGAVVQDDECNLRKNARLLGLPQQMGGLGLQVSAISVLCGSPQVFKAMLLASTPCPIMDVVTGRLLMGQQAIDAYRASPEAYIVGYEEDQQFYDRLLRIGEDLTDERTQQVASDARDTRSLSERFRSTRTNRRSENTDSD